MTCGNSTVGPCAKAYRLLDDLDLGPSLQSAREGAHLVFREGGHPGDDSRWVEASGKLALSLLQAHLIDGSGPGQGDASCRSLFTNANRM